MTTLLFRAIDTVRTWLGLNDAAENRQLELALVPVPVSSAHGRRS